MGSVWLADDTRLHRKVALKTLRALDDNTESGRARLMREAQAAAGLNHTNIAAVHDVIEHDGQVVIVFEFVEGDTLSTRISRGPLPATEAVQIACQISQALISAHAHGVVHRDLKPSNVIVTAGGHVKVLDFGIARVLSTDTTHTISRHQTVPGLGFIGTAGYAAPEQMVSSAVDERADLYALGVILFEMIGGRRPFPGNDPIALASSKLSKDAPPLSSTGRLVPPNLEWIVAALLSRDRDSRPASAADVLEQLQGVFTSPGTKVAPAPPPSPRQWIVPSAIVLVIVAAAGTGLWLRPATPVAPAAPPVVAVMPLANMSGDATKDFVAAGISDSLITSLASLPTVTVLSRAAVTEARGRSPQSSGLVKELGATYLVEGSVQESGGRLRVSLTLVRADRSVAWGDNLEAPLAQIFDLQSRLAERLTGALNVRLSAEDRKRLNTPITADPDALSAYWQGRALLERRDVKGNLDEAANAFRRAITLDSHFALAHAALGETYWQKYVDTRDPTWAQQATDEGQTALRMNANEPAVRYTLAVTLAGNGKPGEAAEELKKALAIQPNYDDARRQLGQVLAQQGEIDQAVTEFQRAIALRPAFWGHYSSLGQALLNAGRYAEAESAFRKVIELQPDNFFGYQQLGGVLHNEEKLDEALKQYEAAIARRPNAQAYSNVGAIQHQRHNYEAAVDAYRHALELRANSHITHRNLGDALVKLGKKSEATKSYEQAIALVEAELKVKAHDPSLTSFLGLYLQKAGRNTEAAASTAEALKAAPSDWQVQFRGAEVSALAGKKSEGLQRLEAAVKAGANTSRIREEEDFESLRQTDGFKQIVK